MSNLSYSTAYFCLLNLYNNLFYLQFTFATISLLQIKPCILLGYAFCLLPFETGNFYWACEITYTYVCIVNWNVNTSRRALILDFALTSGPLNIYKKERQIKVTSDWQTEASRHFYWISLFTNICIPLPQCLNASVADWRHVVGQSERVFSAGWH